MEDEILKEIGRLINIYDNYEFDFEGERVASDVRIIEGETSFCGFDLSFTIEVVETTWFGLELNDLDVFEFNVFDLEGNTIDIEISDQQIEELIKIF